MAELHHLNPASWGTPVALRAERFTATVDARVPGVAEIVACGELDLASAPVLADAFARVGTEPAVVLDLRGVSFCDATGLRTIISADAQLHRAGQPLLIISEPSALRRLFARTGLEHVLQIVDAAPENLLA